MLTEKQTKAFVDFYRSYYGDTSKETGTGKLPNICKCDEEKHIQLWKENLANILGKRKCKRLYHDKQTILDYVFSWLWLGYGPTVVDEERKDTGVEVWGWIDGIAYYEDQFGNRYSRWGSPIMRDEVCSFHHICKIEQVDEYEYKVISFREDGNC